MISETPVLMFDGSIKTAGELKVGDLLMGDDSTPRTVMSVDNRDMETYELVPVKGENIRVCAGQVLSFKLTQCNQVETKTGRTGRVTYAAIWRDPADLKSKQTTHATREEAEKALEGRSKGAVVNMTVEKYVSLNKHLKHLVKHYRVGVDFPRKEVWEPWWMGYWIGDGDSTAAAIASQDSTVLHRIVHMLPQYGLYLRWCGTYVYRITHGSDGGKHVFLNKLREYNLLKNKHVPDAYMHNDNENRLELLAGLLDSDGHLSSCGYYEITQKKKVIADGILYLCRSLGFAAYMVECTKSCMWKGEKRSGKYYRVTISGEGLEHIPVVVPRKKAAPRQQIKDVLVTGCSVTKSDNALCTQVVVDGNHRFLLGNFSVIHDVSDVKLK